jgi:hypothetical protein
MHTTCWEDLHTLNILLSSIHARHPTFRGGKSMGIASKLLAGNQNLPASVHLGIRIHTDLQAW